MIVKKVKPKSNAKPKPKAWQIGDLLDYIRYPHDRNPIEKVEYSGGKNFLSGTHTAQKHEMISLASESFRSKMPVQHWVFSWKENEQPSTEQVEEIVEIFLEKMGLVGHQTVFGLHYNTDNYHLHIAVNRMNQNTGKVVLPHNGFDIEEAHKIVALVEHKQGWESEKKAIYTVLENGELAKRRMASELKPSSAALDFECATGEKSAQRIAQERGHGIIANAESWEELHQKLDQAGLRFEKKGSGAIIFVGDVTVKASSVDRAFSMGKLVRKLGPFVAWQYFRALAKIPPEPVSSVNVDEWKKYQAESTETAKKAIELEEEIETIRIKKRHKIERENTLSQLKKHGLPFLNIARHCLKVQQVQELRSFRQRKSKKRGGKTRFETWLRSRGLNAQADRWRYRARFDPEREPKRPQEKIMMKDSLEIKNFEQYAAAVKADRYRVTCIKMGNDGHKKTFILDKKDGASKGFSVAELTTRMPEIIRIQRRGENIYYTPLSAEKHHILIDDMTQASLGKFKDDGFEPAVILESSPGNYQCILTIPKLKTAFDRDVGNRLTEQLNRLYGDKKLSGCIHPHRAPGFENRKPKHQQEDGNYPQVRLLFAEPRECRKALEFSRRIDLELSEAHKKRQTQHALAPSGATRPGGSVAAYYAHFKNIQKHLAVEDYSRVDAMIALRMRSTGHSRADVAETIQVCAPTIREAQTGRNWQRYAERTADYAFGIAGDMDLAKNERYAALWRKIEGIKEQEPEQPRLRLR